MNTNTGKANVPKQEEILIAYLRAHRSVTRGTAFAKLRIANAPEIIRRLKMRGHKIDSEWCERINSDGVKKRYRKYTLIEEAGKC